MKPATGAAMLVPLATVVFLAATGAGVFTWTLTLASLLLTTAALGLGWRHSPDIGGTADRYPGINTWVLATLVVAAISVIPLSLETSAVFGARRYAQNQRVARSIERVETLTGEAAPPLMFSASRNRAGSLRLIALGTATYGALLLAAMLPAAGARGLLRALLVVGALLAAGGFAGRWVFPQGDRLWWSIQVPASPMGTAGCFINRNHFAGFTAMLCPPAVLLCIEDLRQRRVSAAILSAVCTAILAIGSLAALSRGGTIALTAGLLAVPAWLLHGRQRKAAALGALLVALIAIATLNLAVPEFRERMGTLQNPGQTSSLQSRVQTWRESLDAWRAYPVIGAGPNAFRMVYPQHRTSSNRAHRTHAENQYVELLVDGGMLGVLLTAGLAIAMMRGLRATGSQKGDLAVGVGVTATVVALVHGLGDFPHHVPLYSITWAVFLGMALPYPRRIVPRLPLAPLVACALAVVCACFTRTMGTRDSLKALHTARLPELMRALVWAPTSRHAWYYSGRRLFRSKDPAHRKLGEQLVSQGAIYDPNQYPLHRTLGYMRLELGDIEGARAAFNRVRELRSWGQFPELPPPPEEHAP